MSNLHEYKALVDPSLHGRVFFNDPKLMDANVYVNRIYSGTLQQLYIIRNWDTLSKQITPDELWTYLRLHEFRPSKLVFDSTTGHLIADADSQKLYQQYYYNALWSGQRQRDYINFKGFTLLVILLLAIYYILYIWQQQEKDLRTAANLLNLLEESTKAQQWPAAA